MPDPLPKLHWLTCVATCASMAWFAACLVALLLLSGCAAPSTIVGGAADPLAIAAGRTVDAATAQAAARATTIAESTAAWRQTQDSLSVALTQSSMAMTEDAAHFHGTLAAAGATTAAETTQDAISRAVEATYAAQTPQAAGRQTQAALDAFSAARQQSQAQAVAEFWSWIRTLTIVAIAMLALVLCSLIFMRGLAYIWAEDRAARARIAAEGFRVLSNGLWAEYTDTEGYQVYSLPVPENPANSIPDIVEILTPTPSLTLAWKHALRMFCWHGQLYGFGVRDLGAAGRRVVSDPGWRQLVKILKEAGVLVTRPVKGPDGRTANTTTWADGYDYHRFARDLADGRVRPNHPTDKPPPDVVFTVPDTTPQPDTTQRDATTTATAV